MQSDKKKKRKKKNKQNLKAKKMKKNIIVFNQPYCQEQDETQGQFLCKVQRWNIDMHIFQLEALVV